MRSSGYTRVFLLIVLGFFRRDFLVCQRWSEGSLRRSNEGTVILSAAAVASAWATSSSRSASCSSSWSSSAPRSEDCPNCSCRSFLIVNLSNCGINPRGFKPTLMTGPDAPARVTKGIIEQATKTGAFSYFSAAHFVDERASVRAAARLPAKPRVRPAAPEPNGARRAASPPARSR